MELHLTRDLAKRASSLFLGSFLLFLTIALLVDASLRRLDVGDPFVPLDGVRILEVAAAYFAGGITSCAVLYRLFPIARQEDDAAAIGFVSAVPFLAAIHVAVKGFSDWDGGDVLRLVLLALLIGYAVVRPLWTHASSADGPQGGSGSALERFDE